MAHTQMSEKRIGYTSNETWLRGEGEKWRRQKRNAMFEQKKRNRRTNTRKHTTNTCTNGTERKAEKEEDRGARAEQNEMEGGVDVLTNVLENTHLRGFLLLHRVPSVCGQPDQQKGARIAGKTIQKMQKMRREKKKAKEGETQPQEI